MRRTSPTILLAALLVSCGEATVPITPLVPVDPPGEAAALTITAGQAQSAEVASELPQQIVVKVTDDQGAAVEGQLVNFVVVSGGGSVFAGSALSTAAGEVRERWTLGTGAGEQVLEARAVDQVSGDPITFARITATATPGPVAELVPAAGFASSYQVFVGDAFDATPLVAGAKDQYGNSRGFTLTASTAAGWPSAGATVTPDDAETTALTIASGSATLSTSLTAEVDLRDYTWTMAWSCADFAEPLINGDGREILSYEVAAVVHGIDYAPLQDGWARYVRYGEVFTRHLDDGSTVVYDDAVATNVSPAIGQWTTAPEPFDTGLNLCVNGAATWTPAVMTPTN